MIELSKIYKGNRFKGLVNGCIFQITDVGKPNPDSRMEYVTVKELKSGKTSQTNIEHFRRLLIEECK